MKEEFRQPNEFHIISEFHQGEAAQEFHALSEEYYEPKEEGISGLIRPTKPLKASLLRRMRTMLYMASATVFVTVATQAVYPDFVVFSDPFSANQEENSLPEISAEESATDLPLSKEDVTPEPSDYENPSVQEPSTEDYEEPVSASDSEQSSEIWTDCPDCENGIVLKSRQIYIYNGTPCKACNDVGTFLNVNGEIEECGECRGYASRHQVGEKQIFEYYNEFYRVYAFDESEEYVEDFCPKCGGSGVIRDE